MISYKNLDFFFHLHLLLWLLENMLEKCIENSMENMHTDIRVQRVDKTLSLFSVMRLHDIL